MSSQASYDLSYTKFCERINTLRYQHAVTFCGQQLLHLVMRTLINGDIKNINACVREALGSHSQYKNSFTKNEQQLLKDGDHKKWDINLLFKVIQKVCGLGPLDNDTLTLSDSDDGPIESFIVTLKKLRDEHAHNFNNVTSDDELAALLNKLTTRAFNMLLVLGVQAQQKGKQLSQNEVNETMDNVNQIISNVQEKINEGVPTSTISPRAVAESVPSDERGEYEADHLQYDSAYAAAGTGGYTLREPSWKVLFATLQREFWVYAGANDDHNNDVE